MLLWLFCDAWLGSSQSFSFFISYAVRWKTLQKSTSPRARMIQWKYKEMNNNSTKNEKKNYWKKGTKTATAKYFNRIKLLWKILSNVFIALSIIYNLEHFNCHLISNLSTHIKKTYFYFYEAFHCKIPHISHQGKKPNILPFIAVRFNVIFF